MNGAITTIPELNEFLAAKAKRQAPPQPDDEAIRDCIAAKFKTDCATVRGWIRNMKRDPEFF
ncbi:MAG: hypothetical protein ACRYGK_17015 [Janthinobacterium lividum]